MRKLTNEKGIKRMYRVEDKFCCCAQEMFQLQRRLDAALQRDTYEKGENGYRVVSLYFDDLADSGLIDTKEGNDNRRKYRIRIYNDSLQTIKLEVKEKRGNRVRKMAKYITEDEMRKLIRGQSIEADPVVKDPAFLFNLAIKTQGLRPKVIVVYERKAYLYPPGNVRITFDRNLRVSRQVEDFGQPKIDYDLIKGEDAILEMKYDEFIPSFLTQLLETGSLQQVSYSKYQLCRETYEKRF